MRRSWAFRRDQYCLVAADDLDERGVRRDESTQDVPVVGVDRAAGAQGRDTVTSLGRQIVGKSCEQRTDQLDDRRLPCGDRAEDDVDTWLELDTPFTAYQFQRVDLKKSHSGSFQRALPTSGKVSYTKRFNVDPARLK